MGSVDFATYLEASEKALIKKAPVIPIHRDVDPDTEPLERVRTALDIGGYLPDNHDREAESFPARCPAHDDHSPSMTVSLGDDGEKVVIKCHRGCETGDILDVLGLSWSDLYPASPPEEFYEYVDENGEPFFKIKRYYVAGKKAFAASHPDEHGNWVKGSDDRRVLYHLPEVLAAAQKGEWVVVVEGEKDADRLHSLGFTATTAPYGAEWSKTKDAAWRDTYAPSLEGARVVIIRDNDEIGKAYGAKVAGHIPGAVILDLPGLPVKGDVSDWLEQGHTRDELLQLIEGAEPWTTEDVGGDKGLPRTIEEEREQDKELLATDGFRLTDVGNSYRLIMRSKGELQYVPLWGKWLVWSEGRWLIDHREAQVTEIAKGVPREIMLNLDRASDEPLYTVNNKPVSQRDLERRWAKASESRNAVSAMIYLARANVSVEHEELDGHDELLNCSNVVVNLRTGEWLDHDPSYLMTLQSPVKFDPRAKFEGSEWERFLKRFQPDEEIRHYLQVRSGAGTTGKVTQSLDVDFGLGGNGKSVFHRCIMSVLGPYAVVPHKSLLVAQKKEEHDTVIANLFRMRYAVCSETKAQCTLNEEQVKALTGGDRISGRRMREDPWEFWPSHTLIMFSNYEPMIRGTDNGIWRRVRLVPWAVTIPNDEQDANFAEKLFEAEKEVILNWLIEGAREFLADGIKVPKSIEASTNEYRNDQDTVGRFIHDRIEIGPDFWATAKEMVTEARAWLEEQGMNEFLITAKNLAPALELRGCRSVGQKTVNNVRATWWSGVRIKR